MLKSPNTPSRLPLLPAISRAVISSAPFTTRFHAAGGAKEILQRDCARAAKFLASISPHGPRPFAEAYHHSGGVMNRAYAPTTHNVDDSIDVMDSGVAYLMSVGVGNPPTQYTLLVDTGSGNTWVGANTPYNPTSTSQATGNTVNVSYSSSTMSGEEYIDMITLSSELVIQHQSIGVASSSHGFTNIDGILGVGRTDLTQGTVSNTTEVPTVTDNLYSQGVISSERLCIYYAPSSTANVTNGELTFGEVDRAKITSNVNYVSITSTSPASYYWGIDQSVTYGNTVILDTTAGIVDTGTTLLLLASDAFQAYQQETGATLDQTTGLLTITSTQYANLQPLSFHIGGVTYELTPNAQIWPRALNNLLGGQPNQIYLVVYGLGSPSGSGLDFINGFVWLQRFYSVFDTGNSQVGFATTPYTDADTN